MRRDSGLPRGTWGESGKAPGRCGSQKRKKGPKALFSSTQAETWIMFGAGNGTSTDALSVCFPTLFFAEGFNEGLNFSLVFERRQRRPSTNFHSPPTPSTHLRATPCQGSPLHRVRVARTECASQPCTADHAQDGARQSVAMSIYQDAVEVSPASPPPWPAPIKPHRRSAEASRLDPL